MRVGVDLDGVLHWWNHAVLQLLRDAWGLEFTDLDGDPPHWDWIPANVPPVAWEWLWNHQEAIDTMFDGPVFEGSVAAMALLRSQRHHVSIVTHRPPEARWATLRWLDKHKFEFDSLHFTTDHRKAHWLPDIEVWIDDSSGVAANAVNLKKAMLLWDRNYNRPGTAGVEHDEAKVRRVSTWSEVMSALEELQQEADRASGIPTYLPRT